MYLRNLVSLIPKNSNPLVPIALIAQVPLTALDVLIDVVALISTTFVPFARLHLQGSR